MPLRITSGECSGGEMPAYTVARVRRKAHQVHATSILLLRGDELLDLGLVGHAVQYSLLGLLAQRLADFVSATFSSGTAL
jgi:hypothetical protein